ncbi:MAG: ABC transporter ATP-binding protein [Bacillota bacterium]|nr:MAG: ABC transporter ATP-binding protein [Bacillota bacterium]
MVETNDRPILRATRLARRFPVGEGVWALKRADLTIARGAFVLVTGPSGCGKTTLLNLLGGLDRPTRGDVEVGGVLFSKLNESGLARLRRREIGFVFQFFNLLADLTAAENVELPMRMVGLRKAEAAKRTTELLEAVGMSHRARHTPFELSGGEQQRVAVARALANQPSIVLADEPTGNLDSKNSAEIMELFKRFNRGTGQTFVIVSHAPGFADYADHVVHMKDGEITGIDHRGGGRG